ncbi:MAG: hypothetical protein R3F56_21110 [Planctomycetota bacterium]
MLVHTSTLWPLGLVALFAAAAGAQNLCSNPGFETYATCPTTSGQLAYATGWYSPNAQTPDYLNACSTLTPSVPTNFYGVQAAHGGQAYASFITYGQLPANPREYCAGVLTAPLVAGNTYRVSFWVSLCDKSGYGIAEVGAHLQAGAHSGPPAGPLPVTPQVENASLLTDKVNWVQVSGTFVAAGGEDHIAIGNFRDNAATTAVTVTGGVTQFAIYYVDDVEVVDLTSSGNCDVQLVGWSDLPLPASTGYLDTQDVDACQPARTRCLTAQPVRAVAAYAGGTAYDSRYQTAWVSDGVVLAEYSVDTASTCAPRCAPFRATLSDPQAVVSGLAVADQRPRLFQLATRPGYMEVTTYDNTGRCPGQPVTCRHTLPGTAVAAGLAYDEVEDVLFISVSTPSGAAWSNLLWITSASSPCVPLCETRLFTCQPTLVTGLAFDACSRRLWATDGRTTQEATVTDVRTCQLRFGQCCDKQSAPTYRGLAFVPCWRSRRLGRSCSVAPCPSCPTMHTESTGDPSIGTTFLVRLEDAPVGSTAFLFLQPGTCGAGLALPRPYCGVLYPSLFTAVVLPPAPILGAPPCSGSAVSALSLPVAPNLCGQPMCAQWFVVCPGFGTALSDAFEFTLAGT